MSTSSDERGKLEKSIESARTGVGDRVDQIGRKLREDFDLRRIASEHAPQLMAAGAAFGFLLACGPRKAVVRMLQIGVPIAIAVNIAKRAREVADEATETGE